MLTLRFPRVSISYRRVLHMHAVNSNEPRQCNVTWTMQCNMDNNISVLFNNFSLSFSCKYSLEKTRPSWKSADVDQCNAK